VRISIAKKTLGQHCVVLTKLPPKTNRSLVGDK